MTTVKIYVLYFNDETKEKAEKEYGGNPVFQLLFVPTTVYFETFVITELFIHRCDEWKSYDYVGMISYKAREKCTIPTEFSALDRAKKEGYQIISFHQMTSVNDYFGWTFDGHKYGLTIIDLLSQSMAFDRTKAVPICANYWLMTPSVLFKFILFLRHVKTVFETDSEIRKLVWEDSDYSRWVKLPENFTKCTGLTFYPHHPFILERMTGIFAGDFKCTHYSGLLR